MRVYQDVLLIGLVASIGGLVLGRILRRRAPRASHVLHFGAAALIRLLAAVVFFLLAVALVEDLTLVRVGVAVLLTTLACFSGLTAVLMTYVAVTGRTDAPTRWRLGAQKGRRGS